MSNQNDFTVTLWGGGGRKKDSEKNTHVKKTHSFKALDIKIIRLIRYIRQQYGSYHRERGWGRRGLKEDTGGSNTW